MKQFVLFGAMAFVGMAAQVDVRADEQAPVNVEVAAVKSEAAADTLRVTGNLVASESVTLRPEVAGRIASISFEEGQPVQAGQVLVTLDAAEFEAQVASSAAATRLWELKFERARDLLARNVMSQQEYDETQASLKEARARLELDKVRAGKTVIKAPIAGVLGLRKVSSGDYVQIGDPLVSLAAIDPLKLDFSVPERYASTVTAGQAISITVPAFPGLEFQGKVYAVDPQLDEAGRSLRARGRIANIDGKLRPGMFAQVAVVVARRENALWIPEEAIVPRGGEQYVFRVDDNKALLTRVVIGERRLGVVEISAGLHAGDTVVTAGSNNLHDQAAVHIVNRGTPEVPDV
ncbi:MAG: efflux RND transporter periplasmic adaptor subunit [Gammaproteobacteria bacterium]